MIPSGKMTHTRRGRLKKTDKFPHQITRTNCNTNFLCTFMIWEPWLIALLISLQGPRWKICHEFWIDCAWGAGAPTCHYHKMGITLALGVGEYGQEYNTCGVGNHFIMLLIMDSGICVLNYIVLAFLDETFFHLMLSSCCSKTMANLFNQDHK